MVFTGISPILCQISDSKARRTVPPKKPPKKIAFPIVVVPSIYSKEPAVTATIEEISRVCIVGISKPISDFLYRKICTNAGTITIDRRKVIDIPNNSVTPTVLIG